jgi:hypothetical protein
MNNAFNRLSHTQRLIAAAVVAVLATLLVWKLLLSSSHRSAPSAALAIRPSVTKSQPAPVAAAHADERILHYISDVQIQKDSALEVTETIDVRAEHVQINRGIYRDLPTRYRGPHGGQVRVGFIFEGATLDGAPVPASAEPYANGVRIKVGDPNSYVDVGEHQYVIRYRAVREIGRFPAYDEIYWNATGNGWVFPIDEAEARIHLPTPVAFGRRAAYTGLQGSTASNAEVVVEKPGYITFSTTQPLDSYEGLTVAVAFPKGVVGGP